MQHATVAGTPHKSPAPRTYAVAIDPLRSAPPQMETHTPVSVAAPRSNAGRRPMSADGSGSPGLEDGPEGTNTLAGPNPLAFLAIAASLGE